LDVIEGSFALATFVVIALPGLVYAAVRRWARGEAPEDRNFGLSVARGADFAAGLTGIYMLIFGDALGLGVAAGTDADTLVIRNPRALALTVVGLYLAVPGAIALALNHKYLEWLPVRSANWLRYPQSKNGYSDTPTAWDHAARRNSSSWVKIRKADGGWIGGWFTKGSFASTYPEQKAIYIDQQYQMSAGGNFGTAIPGAGVLVTVSDGDIVIWEDPTKASAAIG
jgi:hypothetical protein